jgi:DNA-directed RNA polymerase subunit RPC12/RpoP
MKRTKPKWNKPGSPQRIRADASKLVPTNSLGRPEFYHDERVKCRDCKSEFVFTASEQQAWYEKYEIPHYAKRVRCEHCSKKHWAHELLKSEYNAACTAAKKKDAGHKEFLTASILSITCATTGLKPFNSARNIGWLRKCRKLRPTSKESLFLLGWSYDLAGKVERALEFYSAFLDKTSETKTGDVKMWRGLAEKRVRELNAN